MDWYTPELVVEMAIKETEDKIRAGKLIPMSENYNFSKDDDATTIHGIFNFFKEFLVDKEHIQLMFELRNKYNDYF